MDGIMLSLSNPHLLRHTPSVPKKNDLELDVTHSSITISRFIVMCYIRY